jgi:hypothetical protein
MYWNHIAFAHPRPSNVLPFGLGRSSTLNYQSVLRESRFQRRSTTSLCKWDRDISAKENKHFDKAQPTIMRTLVYAGRLLENVNLLAIVPGLFPSDCWVVYVG